MAYIALPHKKYLVTLNINFLVSVLFSLFLFVQAERDARVIDLAGSDSRRGIPDAEMQRFPSTGGGAALGSGPLAWHHQQGSGGGHRSPQWMDGYGLMSSRGEIGPGSGGAAGEIMGPHQTLHRQHHDIGHQHTNRHNHSDHREMFENMSSSSGVQVYGMSPRGPSSSVGMGCSGGDDGGDVHAPSEGVHRNTGILGRGGSPPLGVLQAQHRKSFARHHDQGHDQMLPLPHQHHHRQQQQQHGGTQDGRRESPSVSPTASPRGIIFSSNIPADSGHPGAEVVHRHAAMMGGSGGGSNGGGVSIELGNMLTADSAASAVAASQQQEESEGVQQVRHLLRVRQAMLGGGGAVPARVSGGTGDNGEGDVAMVGGGRISSSLVVAPGQQTNSSGGASGGFDQDQGAQMSRHPHEQYNNNDNGDDDHHHINGDDNSEAGAVSAMTAPATAGALPGGVHSSARATSHTIVTSANVLTSGTGAGGLQERGGSGGGGGPGDSDDENVGQPSEMMGLDWETSSSADAAAVAAAAAAAALDAEFWGEEDDAGRGVRPAEAHSSATPSIGEDIMGDGDEEDGAEVAEDEAEAWGFGEERVGDGQ